jgi:hypothetical protein
MIYPQNTQVIYASGALAMSGTLHATALADVGLLENKYYILVKTAANHGIVAGSQLWFSDLDNDTILSYRSNQMRSIYSAPAADTLRVACPEGYTAGAPSTSELYAAGYVSDDNWLFHGFKLHLSAAETSGETLTLKTTAKRGAAWNSLVLTQPMIGKTDVLYFPSVPIPYVGGDSVQFAWTNTGAATWGLEMFVSSRG